MPANNPSGYLSPKQKLHKQAIASGWSYTNHPIAGSMYSKPATHSQVGAQLTSPPIHPDWQEVNTPAGPRYVSNNPELGFKTSATPTDPVAAHPNYQARIAEIARRDDDVSNPRGDVSGTMQASNSVAQPLSPEAASAKRRAAAATARQQASAAGDLGYSKSSGLGGSQENLA